MRLENTFFLTKINMTVVMEQILKDAITTNKAMVQLFSSKEFKSGGVTLTLVLFVLFDKVMLGAGLVVLVVILLF